MKLTNKQLKEAEEIIKETLPHLATVVLAIGDHRVKYTEKEVFEASIVFINTLASKMFEHQIMGKGLPDEEIVAHGERMGKALHKIVKDETGIDLQNIKFD